ncbi:isoleucine--tRNA ligase [Bacteroidetes bacterium endosymbiont of Geopemphigus sp.]|uniref:isoleucine--tRNA ligase n=1 Tax=Bacteroidetes bacterium endosymbiont of Geopemphigus sp. TaxID=2047937 RepID=UPI000CD22FBC|nr:isoleucine--tRNA ligase [Bacteroidetes bacterium endosymbiont of Geopemphigus sp.]
MSKKFEEYSQLHLNECAREISEYWKRNDIFNKSISSRQGKSHYVFYDGPPSANGLPGIHHVMARTIKDVFCRYHTLKGEQVYRKAGWDTHGLPIELGVEKELNIIKEDIGKKISVDEYNKACRASVMRYTDIWKELTDKIGYWVDQENPYITYDSKYIETLWWILKQFYLKGLLYKGYTIQPYSPAAGTGLSTHELNMPGAYKEITDTTITVQFKARKESLPEFLKNLPGEVYFLAWTTTPWTLSSNTALTIGDSIEYTVVQTFNPYTFEPVYVILAKSLVQKVFSEGFSPVSNKISLESFKKEDKKIPYRALQSFYGSDILGSRYEQLLPWVLPYENAENAFQIISGAFVTTEEGTGIVHTAPTFGVDDAIVAKRHNVPPMLLWDVQKKQAVPLVDTQGRFIKEVPEPFSGRYVRNEYYKDKAPERSVDVELAILLKSIGRAFKVEKYKHSYPHCWRTDKPILYYPLDSWFIRTTAAKADMVSLNNSIHWIPESTGKNRFGHWLENLNDWNLSRSRYWGVPLPIWRTEDEQEELIIGSLAELITEIEKSVRAGLMKKNPFGAFVPGDMSWENYKAIDLHKPIVDDILLISPTGKSMKRESDLIDVWFDSGAMPFAQWHYPFENKEKIDQGKFYSADFIAEGVDQTRGWFYTLHAISSMLFQSVAYKNVLSNGLVLDKNGQKMSKSKGNAINPFKILELYGPDATRWYMISNAQPWENIKFDISGIDEVRRKFFGTLYNTYAFFALYANIDGFCYKEAFVEVAQRSELDRWILSELHQLIKKVRNHYDAYDPTRATRAIADFVINDLSNWYVRLCRRRFWKGDYTQDKIAAYQTLYDVLFSVSLLSAPVAPFFSERLYMDLTCVTEKEAFESVHLAYFPEFDEKLIDEPLERRMHIAQRLSSMVFSLRKKENIKVRQPLKQLMILASSSEEEKSVCAMFDLIKQEVNVKEIHFLTSDTAGELLTRELRPNFKKLGPKFGKHMLFVSHVLSHFSQEQIRQFEKQGIFTLKVQGSQKVISLQEVDISIRKVKGWSIDTHEGLTVALDINIDEKLRYEGIARELVNRVQNLRKAQGLEVTDKIKLSISASLEVEKAIKLNKEYICEDTLSASLSLNTYINEAEEIDFEGETIRVSVQKLAYG